MKPVNAATATLVRRALLRAFAAPPAVRIEHVDGCPALVVVATSAVRCRVDDVPVAQMEAQMFLHDGSSPIRHRVGGAFLAAVRAVDGMVVRSGRCHYLVADGALVPIDKRVYRYLLRRTTQIAPVVRLAV